MNRNMMAWVDEMISMPRKKPMPILSFPAVTKMEITVKELIRSSDLQAQAMKLVADETPDAAASVSMMDLSVEAEAFGAQVRFSDHEVPAVYGSLCTDEADVDALPVPDAGTGRTGIYIEAIRKAVGLITDRPVFAGVIGPFSLAGRLTDISQVMLLCMDEPDMVHALLEKTTQFLIRYMRAYRETGADGVLIAEPLAGLLSPSWMEEFSCDYISRIVEAVQTDSFLVAYHNCGNTVAKAADILSGMGCRMLHFGNSVDMEQMLAQLPSDLLVLGNIDPAGRFRNGSPEEMRAAVLELLRRCSSFPNYVISSGCDIPPLTGWDKIHAFYAAVKEFYTAERER